jgi:ribonuclease-3
MHNVQATAERIEAITSYKFTQKLLCAEAAQMASPQTAVIYDGSLIGVDNNRRLSILGDVVLAKALCARWYEARDDQSEHDMHSVLPHLLNDKLKAKRGRLLTGRSSAIRS